MRALFSLNPPHHRLSFNRQGRWGTTDDFTTSFLHFSLFSTALWNLANSRPVHSLMSSQPLLYLPCLLLPFTVPCKIMVLARPDERETCPYQCSGKSQKRQEKKREARDSISRCTFCEPRSLWPRAWERYSDSKLKTLNRLTVAVG